MIIKKYLTCGLYLILPLSFLADPLKIPLNPQCFLSIPTLPKAKANNQVVILIPGDNQEAVAWVTSPFWQNFSTKNSIPVVGLTLKSSLKNNRGFPDYYNDIVIQNQLALKMQEIFSSTLWVLYGFSGGAHFVNHLINTHHNKQIKYWIAYSARYWEPPVAEIPRGMVMCGNKDFRFGACLNYYHDCSKLRPDMTWVSIHNLDHCVSLEVDELASTYIIENSKESTESSHFYVNYVNKQKQTNSVFPNWMINQTFYNLWLKLHVQ
jgi:hypothetical protein